MSATTTHIDKKKSLAPKLRFKGYDEELLPTKFGKVVQSNLYGPRFNADDYSESGNVKTIRGTDLGRDGEIKYHQVPLARLDDNTVANHKLIEGDIVMITTADCGATGVFRKQEVEYLSSAYGVRIRLNELGYPYYFKYFFQTRLARKEINSFIRKATVANLPGSDILKIKLYLPTLPEQQKIASFLSAVDEKIQQLTRKKELLEQYKKGVMQQLFSGKLRFMDEMGKEFPKWVEKRLDEVANFRRGSFPQPYGLAKWFDEINGLPFVQVYDVDDNMLLKPCTKTKISKLAAEQSVFVKEGTLVITIQGSIGRIAKTQYDAYVDRTLLIFQSYKKPIDVNYFKYVVSLLFEIEKTKAPGGTIKTITKEALSSFKIMIPQIDEQKKIASYLSNIDNKIESVNKQIAQTQIFKNGLLQQMFV